MDISFLFEYINPIILGICLCLGYALKVGFKSFNNNYIPITMLVVGTLISVLINIPNINAAVVLGGMISGLASTGLYEAMRNLLDKDGKKGDGNNE